MSPLHFRDPYLLVRYGRARRNVAEIFLDLLFRRFRVNIAGQHDDHVGRPVIILEPFLHVLECSSVQVGHVADDVPGIGVTGGICIFRKVLLGQTVRLVLPLTFFVLHHAALQVESLLAQIEESHAVRFHK